MSRIWTFWIHVVLPCLPRAAGLHTSLRTDSHRIAWAEAHAGVRLFGNGDIGTIDMAQLMCYICAHTLPVHGPSRHRRRRYTVDLQMHHSPSTGRSTLILALIIRSVIMRPIAVIRIIIIFIAQSQGAPRRWW